MKKYYFIGDIMNIWNPGCNDLKFLSCSKCAHACEIYFTTWSYSSAPGYSGHPRNSSAITHPSDHMSMASQNGNPSMISGALQIKHGYWISSLGKNSNSAIQHDKEKSKTKNKRQPWKLFKIIWKQINKLQNYLKTQANYFSKVTASVIAFSFIHSKTLQLQDVGFFFSYKYQFATYIKLLICLKTSTSLIQHFCLSSSMSLIIHPLNVIRL